MIRHWPDDCVNVIGHNNPFMQHVSVFVKVLHCSSNEIGNLWPAQMTIARTSVQITFNFAAKVAGDLLFRVVYPEATVFKLMEPTQPFRLFHSNSNMIFFGSESTKRN